MVRFQLVCVLLLATTLLAGCLGGDDDPTPGGSGAGGHGPAEGTGAIAGQVFTVDLDLVENARASLVDDGELVAETRSDAEGRFEITDMEAGTYRLQVTATCCREAVQGVEVVEGETVNVDLQLERFSTDDLAVPYMEEYEWTGFLACGYVVLIRAGDACADFDEDSDRTHEFQLDAGIKTLTASLTWDATGGVLGEELQYGLAQHPCTEGTAGACSTPGDYFGYNVGVSPLELRIDDTGEDVDAEVGNDGNQAFQDVEEPLDVQLRVFPPFSSDVDVFYQQEFTVHYQLHYHKTAAADFNPTPDN